MPRTPYASQRRNGQRFAVKTIKARLLSRLIARLPSRVIGAHAERRKYAVFSDLAAKAVYKQASS